MLPFSFKGQIRRLPYAAWSLGLFFSQHLVVLTVFKMLGVSRTLDWWFLVIPLRSLVTFDQDYTSNRVLLLAFAYLLIVAWALAALAFRRAANADISEWIAAAAMAPIIQIPVIAYLCIVPARVAGDGPPVAENDGAQHSSWAPAVQGVVAGLAFMLFAVAISTLLFGVYGYGLFVVSPFVIGAITAYFANRKRDLGARRTAQLVAGAIVLGGIGLVAIALEGSVCIIMASPLGLGVALIGGLLGRSIAVWGQRPPRQALSGLALLPLIFALEYVLPAETSFDTHQTIEVNAPAEAVWKAILHMDMSGEPLALPFLLGVAYPIRGDVVGEGVGALRHGEFSTGTAIERVTEWVPNRKLAFVVVNDVPSMRELSPYEHVHAPHVIGYFRTSYTSFELVERANGHTELVERTTHQLKLDPVLYWLPMARWVVHANNARVLAHIQRQAEQGFE
jgi:Polyketide cyclase / dehydrase and lipid transport.